MMRDHAKNQRFIYRISRFLSMKKGFFFSLFVITALALIVLNFKTQIAFREERQADIFTTRVDQINLFIEDMESDIERVIYISAYRAFLGAEEYIYKNNKWLNNTSKNISEMMIYGTLNKNKLNATNASTIHNWSTIINDLALRYNINITFENIEIGLYHKDSWTINVSMNSTIIISDFEKIVSWNFTIEKSTLIDIAEANFSDPLYFVYALQNNPGGSPIKNYIRKTSHSDFWWNNSGTIDVTNLSNHTNLQMYKTSTRAPSYMMRLEGKASSSIHGIESFVNVLNPTTFWMYSNLKIPSPPIPTCVVDYQFFVSGCGTLVNPNVPHAITNMNQQTFFLDDNYLVDYELTKINST